MKRVKAYESVLAELNPSPVFSAGIETCVAQGVDAYAGGMTYNNASINCIGLADAVDSVIAVRHAVFRDGAISLSAFRDILARNWADAALLRLKIKKTYPKYGNGEKESDAFAAKLTDYCGRCINQVPNARGGVFRMGLFSIDWTIMYGKRTGATPNGRLAGEPISKNLCAVIGADLLGPTALARTAAALDTKHAVNGAVLDVLIHPTAVQGESGLHALSSYLLAFFEKNGQSIQFNILDAAQLRRAQKEPEKYSSLQIRVCGWNAYFVNLNETEQMQFIQQADGGEALCGV